MPTPQDEHADLVEVIIGQNSSKLKDLINRYVQVKRRVQAARLGVVDDIPRDSLRIFEEQYCRTAFRSTTHAQTIVRQSVKQ